MYKPENTEAKQKEFYVPVQDYLQVAQIKKLGRPLWAAYEDIDVLKMATVKLLGGSDPKYDPSNKNHVFAVMAARVSLDVAIASSQAYSFLTNAVDAHLRVVMPIHIEPPTFETQSLSEPVIARTASTLLCGKSDIWNQSLKTLHHELLSPGLLDAGPWGKLAARYIMVLAQDHLWFWSTGGIDQNNMFTIHCLP